MSRAAEPSHRVIEALSEVEERLDRELDASDELEESPICIPVVGEFSSGKSRVIKEMLAETVPERLLPVSSNHRETLLPLEVTFGTDVQLQHIRREYLNSDDVEVLDRLEEFPTRQDLEPLDPDPKTSRLRLTAPIDALLWPNKTDEGARRVYLVDTPGWNSGESRGIEEMAVGDMIPAIIWVSKLGRLDSAQTRKDLNELLASIEDIFPPGDASLLHLFSFVTFWIDSQRNREHLTDTATNLEEMAGDRPDYATDVEIREPLRADFKECSDEHRAKLQTRFWGRLEDLRERPDALTKLDTPDVTEHVEGWNIYDELQDLLLLLEDLEESVEQFFDDRELFPSINMTRLNIHLDHHGDARKLRRELAARFDFPLDRFENVAGTLPDLNDNHPMTPWWSDVLIGHLTDSTRKVTSLFARFDELLEDVTPEIEDLNRWWFEHLFGEYDSARRSVHSTTRLFPPSVRRRIRDRNDLPAIMAIMIAASSRCETSHAPHTILNDQPASH